MNKLLEESLNNPETERVINEIIEQHYDDFADSMNISIMLIQTGEIKNKKLATYVLGQITPLLEILQTKWRDKISLIVKTAIDDYVKKSINR